MELSHKETKEVLDRLRRIETRVTKFMEMQGFETGVQRPLFNPMSGRIMVPSLSCSIADLRAVVPASWPLDDEIEVWHQDEYVMSIYTAAMKVTGTPGG